MSLYPEGTDPSTGDNLIRVVHKCLERAIEIYGDAMSSPYPEGVTPSTGDDVLRATTKLLCVLNAADGGGGGTSVKVLQVVDTTARLALTSSQVNIGDYVQETGQELVLEISGAGSSVANGLYTEFDIDGDDVDESYLTYINANETCFIFYSLFNGCWVISTDIDTGTVLYYDDNYGSLLIAANFLASSGSAPDPVLSVEQAEIAPAGTYVALSTADLSVETSWQAINPEKSIVRLNWNLTGGETVFGSAWSELTSFNVVDAASRGDAFTVDGNKVTINRTGVYLISITLSISKSVLPSGSYFLVTAVYVNGSITYPTAIVSPAFEQQYSVDEVGRRGTSFPIRFVEGQEIDLRIYGNYPSDTLDNQVLRGDMVSSWSIIEL